MRSLAFLMALVLMPSAAFAASVLTVTEVEVVEVPAFEAAQAQNAQEREKLSSRVDDLEAGDAAVRLELSAINSTLAEILARLDSSDDAPVVVPPDPVSHFDDLAPGQAGFFGRPMSDVAAFLTRHNDMTAGTGFPAATFDRWCPTPFDPLEQALYAFCGGHNDGGNNAVTGYSLAELKPFLVRPGFDLQSPLPAQRQDFEGCPYPGLWGEEHGPHAVHAYDGGVFNPNDGYLYYVGGFGYTCLDRLTMRSPAGIWRIKPTDPDPKWEMVRRSVCVPNPDPNKAPGCGNGGSQSWAADILPGNKLLISTKNSIRLVSLESETLGEYILRGGGDGNMGAHINTVFGPTKTDGTKTSGFILTFDYTGRLGRIRWSHDTADESYSVGFAGYYETEPGKKLRLPGGFEYLTAAAYHPGQNVVIVWTYNNPIAFVDLEGWDSGASWIPTVRNLPDLSLRSSGVSHKVRGAAGRLHHLKGDTFIGMARWQDGVAAIRVQEDVRAHGIVPPPPAVDLQSIVDKAAPGTVLTLDRPLYKGAIVRKDGIELRCAPGTKIRSAINEQGVIIAAANDLVVRGCDIEVGHGSSGRQAAIWGSFGSHNISLLDSYIHDGNQGIITCKSCVGTTTLIGNRFERLGGLGGLAHAVYITQRGEGTVAIVRDNVFVDTKDKAHHLKSRAELTEVTGNVFETGESVMSRVFDLPFDGRVIFNDNKVTHRRPPSENGEWMCYGCEQHKAVFDHYPLNQITMTGNEITCIAPSPPSRGIRIHWSAADPTLADGETPFDSAYVNDNNTVVGCGEAVGRM